MLASTVQFSTNNPPRNTPHTPPTTPQPPQHGDPPESDGVCVPAAGRQPKNQPMMAQTTSSCFFRTQQGVHTNPAPGPGHVPTTPTGTAVLAARKPGTDVDSASASTNEHRPHRHREPATPLWPPSPPLPRPAYAGPWTPVGPGLLLRKEVIQP